ncbi:MAG: tRNA (N6-threonylcarbamoyladenosine(37)-N6)-methyltransferase TrmO [Gammaproteobacteria bacterium]|nr:tRNA (N6-threonylcarbamoyladenosine(37)-N6)-methyltransferase TrmO [Gammaproteobacteria bacterium]
MSESDTFTLHPIGHVHTAVADADVPRRRRDIVSTIELLPRYAAALRGIEAYSHLIVLFWMDRATPSAELTCHPRGNPELPLTGVLAARGRNHPNPVGLAVTELLEVRDHCLTVRRLDAYDGTPVIDIKPYDDYDRVEAPRVPAWFSARARSPRER